LTPLRLIAIGFIYACAAIAWFSLGASVVSRTGESDARLAQEVAQLWGGHHNQLAPTAWYERPREVVEQVQEKDEQGRTVTRQVTRTVMDRIPLPLTSSRLRVDLKLDQRRKGLLWYDTYEVGFAGTYRLRHPEPHALPVFVHFTFPSTEALYDGFVLRVDGQELAAVSELDKGITGTVGVSPGKEAVIEVVYRSRGLGEWTYAFASSGVAQVKDFDLDLHTDFEAIDFPAGTISPGTKARDGSGWRLGWRFSSLVTGQRVGVDAPNRINPGPLAARITFFAPVSLLFFMTVMVILGVLRGHNLHPVNYAFLAAAFFAFHLLLAYLVDHVNVHAAFALAAATSVFLVVTYLRLVGGMRLALREAGTAQVVFLVLFSYAFFFEGYTGLTVTVGAVLTLFVLMQLTGRVDWGQVFARKSITRA
jgi:inner membrane protein CreD